MNTLTKFLIGGSFGLFLFSLRVQFFKDFGNIWIRQNQFGVMQFRPMNLLYMMMETFKFSFFWRIDMLDINWIAYVTLFGFFGVLILPSNKD